MSDEISSPDLPASAPMADVRALVGAAGRSHGGIIVPEGLSPRSRGVLTSEASRNFRSGGGDQIHFADPARTEFEVSATPRKVEERRSGSFTEETLRGGRGDGDPKRASVGRVAGAVLKSIFGEEASHDVGIAARRVDPETDKPRMETRVDVSGEKVTAGIKLKF